MKWTPRRLTEELRRIIGEIRGIAGKPPSYLTLDGDQWRVLDEDLRRHHPHRLIRELMRVGDRTYFDGVELRRKSR